MRSIFFFEGNSKMVNYGINSYSCNFILQHHSDYQIFIVKYHFNTFKEVKMIINEQFTTIYFPSPLYYLKTHNNELKYGDRIVELLNSKVKGNDVIVHVSHHDDYEVVKAIKCKTKWPVVFLMHTLLINDLFAGNKNEILNYIGSTDVGSPTSLVRKEFELVKMADVVLCTTDGIKDFILKYYSSDNFKIVMKPWLMLLVSINKIIHTFKSQRNTIIKTSSDEKVIVFSGRINSANGIDSLIKCFRLLLDRFNNLKLVLIGGGAIEKFLPLCYGLWNKIIFTGFLEQSDVYEIYKVADIGVLPAHSNYFSYSALEMSIAKIPLVITNTEGFIERFEDRINCLMVEREIDEKGEVSISPEKLFLSISELLSNSSLRRAIVNNAVQSSRYESQVSIENIYEKFST